MAYGIWYNVGVAEDTCKSVMNSIMERSSRKAQAVDLYMSTGGGCVDSALLLHNFIRSRPEKVNIYNMGKVDSAGLFFFLSVPREQRVATPGSTFFFHEIAHDPEDRPTISHLKEIIENLKALEKQVLDIMLRETDLTEQEIRALWEGDVNMTAEEALECGIVGSIDYPKMLKDTVHISESEDYEDDED